MAYTFDGSTKIISLSSGVTTLDLIDLHSRWKDWVRTDNAGYSPAFLTIGGDIPAIPLYLFLINGWRIKPQEANHTLTVTNGILEVEGGAADPFIDTVGNYKVRINRETPGIAIGYSSIGSDPATIASAVWNHTEAVNIIVRLKEVWGRLGLDIDTPLITGQTQITFGTIVMALTENANTVTVTRQ